MNIGLKINRLKNEDLIWITYIFIAVAALYSNNLEKKFYKTGNKNYYKKEKTINIIVLTIALLIYIYFVIINFKDLNIYHQNTTNKEFITKQASLIAAILFLVGGAIYLILEINSSIISDDINLL